VFSEPVLEVRRKPGECLLERPCLRHTHVLEVANHQLNWEKASRSVNSIIGKTDQCVVRGRQNQMRNILQFVRVLALGTWVGAIIYFVAVVTRAAFALLTRDHAGLMVGFTLGGLHQLGVIAAVVYFVAALGVARSLRALARPAALGVILMLLLTLASQRIVIPRMDVLRAEMVSVDATPASDPRRAEFDRLHGISVDLEGGVLLIGLVALFLTTRERSS